MDYPPLSRLAMLSLLLSPLMAQSIGYDAVSDFKITSNPNGTWLYGSSNTLGGAFTLHNIAQVDYLPGINQPGVDRWTTPTFQGSLGVMHNKTGSVIQASSYTIPPDMLVLHPGWTGQSGIYEVVRWVAPQSASYTIQGAFAGLDVATSFALTDVHVLLNSATELIPAAVLHGVASPSVPFSINIQLHAGDTLDFAVGINGNTTTGNANDSTGLKATITQSSSTPVILIHGWCSDPTSFGKMQQFLTEDLSVPIATYDYSSKTRLSNYNSDVWSIESIATDFGQAVKAFLSVTGHTQVDVVAHSMGGLVARSWISGLSGTSYSGQVRRLITLSTPQYGHEFNRIDRNLVNLWVSSGASLFGLGQSCSQIQFDEMRFGSTFLSNLHDNWYSVGRTLPSGLLFLSGVVNVSTFSPAACNSGNCGDEVVRVQSAVLPDAANIRYVPYSHTTIESIDDRTHKTYQVIQSYLRENKILDQTGPNSINYNPEFFQGFQTAEGFVVVRVRDASDGSPVSSVKNLTFTPSGDLPSTVDRSHVNKDGGAITYFPIRAPDMYDISIGLSGGYVDADCQSDSDLCSRVVQRLRPTVLPNVPAAKKNGE